MKGKELLITYPRVGALIREWFTKKMIESMTNDIPEDFRNYMKERGATDEFLVNVIDKNPAALFEIFDSVHVYIGIVVRKSETGNIVFNYFVCPEGDCLESVECDFNSRKDVEYYAMLTAMQYIDNNIDKN